MCIGLGGGVIERLECCGAKVELSRSKAAKSIRWLGGQKAARLSDCVGTQ